MASSGPPPSRGRPEDNGPPCKRCGNRSWVVEEKRKTRLRWIVETVFAAPDVWIFQGESGGWPPKFYQLWSCRACGRKVKL